MEKLNFKKFFGLGAIGASILALSGCGSGNYEEPTIDELRRDGQFFEMTKPDGEEMLCWSYIARGSEGHAGFSWLAVTCDWDSITDPNLVTPTTEIPTTTLPSINTQG